MSISIVDIGPQIDNLVWGYISSEIKPVAHIASGATVRMTTLPAGDVTKLHPDRSRVSKYHLEALDGLSTTVGFVRWVDGGCRHDDER